MAPLRVASQGAAVAVLAFVLSACGRIAVSSGPSHCNGISAEIGGCDNPPTYTGTTCAAVALEWGQHVNDRIGTVIDGPESVGGKRKSARIQDVLILATVTLAGHLQATDALGSCSAEDVWAGAQSAFDARFKSGIPSALYDGSPVATWEQFDAEARRALSVLDFPIAT